MRIQVSSFCVLLALGMSVFGMGGCGVQPAAAPTSLFEPEHLRPFPKENLTLTSNQVFFWRPGMTDLETARVFEIAELIDGVNARSTPLAKDLRKIEEEIDSLDSKKKEQAACQKKLFLKQKELKSKSQELDKLEKEKTELSSSSNPDSTKIAELSKKIDELKTVREQLSADASELQKKNEDLKKEVRDSAEEVRLKKEPLLEKKAELEEQQSALQNNFLNYLNEAMDLVDWVNPPLEKVVFQFKEAGDLGVSVSGWVLDPKDGKRDFSTQAETGKKPTIVNAKYTDLGGIYEFEVNVYEDVKQVYLNEVYSFKISRTKYHAEDHRVYLSGKVEKYEVDEGGNRNLVQTGIAKFVDNSN